MNVVQWSCITGAADGKKQKSVVLKQIGYIFNGLGGKNKQRFDFRKTEEKS
jgi:hypothetical protein